MPWRIVQRKIGRAGGIKKRTAQQREWDRLYGDWAVGYVIDGEFITQDEALESIYQRSYDEHFQQHPDDLAELISREGVAKPSRRSNDRRRPASAGNHKLPCAKRAPIAGY